MEEEPTTEELRRRQAERESAAREGAETEATNEGTAQHERRADKAEYLKEKLKERSEAVRDAD
jgi:hypothetical protein